MSVSALRNPNFLKFLIGTTFSTLGFWVQKVALGWLAWELTESPFWVGVISLCMFLPIILTSPLFGVFVDRCDLRRAMIATMLLMMAGTTTLMVSIWMGVINEYLLVAMSLYSGFILSAFHPIRLAILPAIVTKSQLPRAVASIATIFNLSQMAGPAVGGILIAKTDTSAAFLFSALGLIPQVIIVSFLLEIRPRDTEPAANFNFLNSLKEGFHFSVNHPVIRYTLVLTALVAAFGKGLIEILPAVSEVIFQRGSSGLGELMSTVGIGAVSASAYMSSTQLGVVRLPRFLTVGIILLGLVLILLGASSLYWLSLLAVGGLGVAISFTQISSQTLVQLQVADDVRARVMSLWGILSLGFAGIGALIIGAVAEWIGLGLTIIVIGMVISVPGYYCAYKLIEAGKVLTKDRS